MGWWRRRRGRRTGAVEELWFDLGCEVLGPPAAGSDGVVSSTERSRRVEAGRVEAAARAARGGAGVVHNSYFRERQTVRRSLLRGRTDRPEREPWRR